MGYRIKSKNDYEKQLHTYLARIEQYKNSIAKIKRKVRRIKKNIDSYAQREGDLARISNLVKEYTGVSVKMIGADWSGDKKTAKNLFYKYTIDNGFLSRDISRFCGLSNKASPMVRRGQYTKSFKTNKAAKDFYKRFVHFVENQK